MYKRQTVPGRRSPEARTLVFIRVSVIPYRSTTCWPVTAVMRPCTVAGSAADPDTSSRAARKPAASDGSASTSVATREYIVGTPNITPPPLSASEAAATENRPRWWTVPPRRSGPSTPRPRPCTWNSGSACTTTSSAVHSHAAASASRLLASARCGSTTPLGGPVVPEV